MYVILNTCDVYVEFLDCVGIMDLTGKRRWKLFRLCLDYEFDGGRKWKIRGFGRVKLKKNWKSFFLPNLSSKHSQVSVTPLELCI